MTWSSSADAPSEVNARSSSPGSSRRRFASVTCLNGHVHQLFTKTEGNVTFFSATTTAYPLPKPGDGPAPSPVTLPAGQLHAALGIREVGYVGGGQRLAVKDQRLA